MTMSVCPGFTHTRTGTTYDYEIEGAPPLQLDFRSSSIIPGRVSVWFVDGAWQRVTISGGTLKKDGTAGLLVAENVYYPSVRDLPDWAQPLITARGM
jgi:hypothetical protein